MEQLKITRDPPKKPNCTTCGKKKTYENTRLQETAEGVVYFWPYCNDCHTIRMREIKWKPKSLEELWGIYDDHMLKARRVRQEILRREALPPDEFDRG